MCVGQLASWHSNALMWRCAFSRCFQSVFCMLNTWGFGTLERPGGERLLNFYREQSCLYFMLTRWKPFFCSRRCFFLRTLFATCVSVSLAVARVYLVVSSLDEETRAVGKVGKGVQMRIMRSSLPLSHGSPCCASACLFR